MGIYIFICVVYFVLGILYNNPLEHLFIAYGKYEWEPAFDCCNKNVQNCVASKLGFVIKKGTSKVIITVGYWDEFNFYIICRN